LVLGFVVEVAIILPKAAYVAATPISPRSL
jgi:hypothetical protein